MSKLRFYLVATTEYSGYDCSGHRMQYIVAASSPEEADSMFPIEDWEEKNKVVEFSLPDLSHTKKAFVVT